MNQTLRRDAETIIQTAIREARPDTAVHKALQKFPNCRGKIVLVAIGKAAWQMANSAYECLGEKIDRGIIITKYGHSLGPIGNMTICEAGHPVPDENSYSATQQAWDMTEQLDKDDIVLFLISGGGSALFESPLIPKESMENITRELLASGADISEINTIRKRFSKVKGGRFGEHCSPAKVFCVILSDVLGDRLDMIASGPAYPDTSTSGQAFSIAEKYHLTLSNEMQQMLKIETPKELSNVFTCIAGNVTLLCKSAERTCRELGYTPIILTTCLACEARDAGAMLAELAWKNRSTQKSLAFIAGGETVVHLIGKGKGGRNQEIALKAAIEINGMEQTAVFSVGSDGTDGPTDAAGGYADGQTLSFMEEKGISAERYLNDNNSYEALSVADGLIVTGPTGTNVNDLSVLLIRR